MPGGAALVEAFETPIWEVGALLAGLVAGSFANVCIHRLPRGGSVIHPRSHCPRCGAAIRAWQNVPVLSWLLLGRRCASCREPISWRYPAVELTNGLVWLALAVLRGPSPAALVAMPLATALLVLALVDLDHQILPNVITLPGTALGLVASGALPGPPSLLEAALAAAGGYLALAAVAKLYEKTRGVEGLGQGDWKMAAMLGAFLGWQQLLLTVFLASLAGTAVGLVMIALARGSGRTALPLGTFLGAAGIAVLLAGRPLIAWYGSLF